MNSEAKILQYVLTAKPSHLRISVGILADDGIFIMILLLRADRALP